jgi:hypothetical protein
MLLLYWDELEIAKMQLQHCLLRRVEDASGNGQAALAERGSSGPSQ